MLDHGLWTTGGHYILAVGASGDEIEIYDPYLYDGKFDSSSRRGAGVSVVGTSCFVQIDKFKAYSNIQRLWAINVGVQPEPQPTPSGDHYIGETVTINGVYTSSTSTNKLSPAVKTGTITYISEGAPNPYLLNNGNIGWINDSCIVGGTPAPTPAPTPSGNKTGVVTANGGLNVRSGPSTDYPRVGGISKGSTVTIYEEQNGWYRIGNGQWVTAQYVSVNGTSSTSTKYVKVNSALNVRSGPSTSYSVVGSLSNGTQVTVYAEQNGWSRIGDSKWVSSQYLVSSGGTSRNTVGQTKKLANTTYLYENPDLTGTVYTYKPNTTVVIKANVSDTIDKVYVTYTGRTAYCNCNAYK